MNDKFLGLVIQDYIIEKHIGDGCIGSVYCARRTIGDVDNLRAIKFIKNDEQVKDGWENEITKVIKLGIAPGVVKYYTHGTQIVAGEEYIFIILDYIPGKSLKELVEEKQITIPLIVDVLEKVLAVLHACKQVNIEHADLHWGNIIVEDYNPILVNPEQRGIWVTDFGYLTAIKSCDILNDFNGLNKIVQDCLRIIDFHTLDISQRNIHRILKNEIPRLLLETNPTVGDYVRNPKNILTKWKELYNKDENTILPSQKLGDYLVTESIYGRYDEWKNLFVPKFLAIDELLAKEISVLTGLRGCGKTMIFRRLTALYDIHLGPSNVPGAESFIGFYLNSRNIAEGFPWLPDNYEEKARNQVINFFHLSWCLEILDWLKEKAKIEKIDLSWLSNLFVKYYPHFFSSTNEGVYIVEHITTLINSEMEKSRLESRFHYEYHWELTDYNFLENLSKEIILHCGIGDKPVFFFLDDYSTPFVKSSIQRILNPIVFRRSPIVFFKVATESVESFESIGLNAKKLEEGHDYNLIDFGTQSMLIRESEKIKEMLSAILHPRIERHDFLKDRNLNLESILGKTKYDNNQLAHLIRSKKTDGKKELYQGFDVFCSVWSSSIRESISLFAEMISSVPNENLKVSNKNLIDDELQNRIYKETGGRLLNQIEAATSPMNDFYSIRSSDGVSYGSHLAEIMNAFQEIASYDLKNKDSKNQTKIYPKQARRIEIKGITKDLSLKAQEYYKGLIRYGLFIRDNRGKSVSGKIVPRLYLRGSLIPYFRLTFSKRDSITLSWDDFEQLLEKPQIFKENYIKRMSDKLGQQESLNLWDDQDE